MHFLETYKQKYALMFILACILSNLITINIVPNASLSDADPYIFFCGIRTRDPVPTSHFIGFGFLNCLRFWFHLLDILGIRFQLLKYLRIRLRLQAFMGVWFQVVYY